MARTINPSDIVFTITPEPEHTSPRDDFDDEAMVAKIEKDRKSNEWAWCIVKVTASFGGFEGTNYLSGCSYKDEDEFANGGYLPQMQDEAIADLKKNIKAAGWELGAGDLSDQLREQARTIIGDGKTPNVHFAVDCLTGSVLAVFVGGGPTVEKSAIDFADQFGFPVKVEDRLTGVVHDNEASDEQQRRLARQEESA